jgi:hypothetical protein
MNTKLRIGILLDSIVTDAWIGETIRLMSNSSDQSIEVVIAPKPSDINTTSQKKFFSGFSSLCYRLYTIIDRRIYSSVPDAFAKVDISGLIKNIHRIEVEPVHEIGSERFSNVDITRIQSYSLDIIIKLGFKKLSGQILTHASKFGVWGFENCDQSHGNRKLGNFRDVLERRGVTLSELKKISDDHSDLILYRSYSMTNHTSVNRNYNEVCWKSITFLPRVLHDLATHGDFQFFESIKNKYAQSTDRDSQHAFMPSNIRVINRIARFWTSKVIQKIHKLFTFEQWTILFNFYPQALSFNVKEFHEIRPPKDRFWADPHIIFHDDQYYVFIEELIYKHRRAHLSVITIDKNGNHGKPKIVLQKPYHLSYPFVFKHGPDYFMIPETGEHRTIELYRCIHFPDKWEFVMNLKDNIEAVDTTLLFRNDRWWMFVNMREHPGMSFSDELFLFSSTDLFSTSWKPHPKNPIVSDVRHARPAGKIFEHDNALYRPGQDCSVRYGHRIQIHQILKLNESDYEEKVVRIIEPDSKRNLLGVHTLASQDGITIVDGEFRRNKYF